ncbi:MAG TPA: hypothetical protein VL334_12390 [Anaerolineae bacterium]|nr:hypothetical protein [Anaerolineae bacterium]
MRESELTPIRAFCLINLTLLYRLTPSLIHPLYSDGRLFFVVRMVSATMNTADALGRLVVLRYVRGDEDDRALVAATVGPAVKHDFLTSVSCAQVAASVGSLSMG